MPPPLLALSDRLTLAPSLLVWLPGLVRVTLPAVFTVQVKAWLWVLVPSVTVMMGSNVPRLAALALIVPPMTPVLVPIVKPVGRPVAVNVKEPLPVVLARICNATPSPTVLLGAGTLRLTALLTYQLRNCVSSRSHR